MKLADRKEKLILDRIGKALQNHESHIEVPTFMTPKRLEELLTESIEENPEWFMIQGFKTMYSPVAGILYPDYCFEKLTADDYLRRCSEIAQSLSTRALSKPQYDQILIIHDLLSRNVQYAYGTNREFHCIVGPLLQKQAVCEGFAKAFKYLMDGLQIPCLVISGTGYNQGRGTTESHAWNLVQIDGNWLHVDVTFDTTIRSNDCLRYDYFLLTDDAIRRDHGFDSKKYPKATDIRYSYYRRHNLVMERREQVREGVTQCISRGVRDFIFQLPANVRTEGLERKVIDEVQNELLYQHSRKGFTCSFNLTQRVFHIHFQ